MKFSTFWIFPLRFPSWTFFLLFSNDRFDLTPLISSRRAFQKDSLISAIWCDATRPTISSAGAGSASSLLKLPTMLQRTCCCACVARETITHGKLARQATVAQALGQLRRNPCPACTTPAWCPAQPAPIQVVALRPAGKRAEQHLRRDAAVGERNSRGGGGSQCRADSGNNFVRDIRAAQRFQFFAGAAKHGRIAAFQSHHGGSGLRVGDQQRIDFVLGEQFAAGALADVDDFRARRNQWPEFPR